MKVLRFFCLLILACATLGMHAQASFSLVPPRRAVEGQKFTVTFRVSNGDSSEPAAPAIENCRLVYGPSSTTMSSTQIVNGHMTSSYSVDYTFTYQAEKAGTVTIPAVTVSIDGKQHSSKPAQLTILPPDQTSAPQQGYGQSQGSASSAPSHISDDDMFVRISLNKSTAYEQEAVVASVKVYTRCEISSFQITAQPTFEGFLSEELSVPSGMEMEHYNGKNYYTAYLKRCIIYPQKAGNLTITSGKYDVTLVDYEVVSNGFFQTRRPIERHVTTSSNNSHLNVIALPEPKPEGFNGAVGDYTATVQLSPEELRTNEAASYVIDIAGTGNIKYLKTPVLDLPAGIDEFTPKTDIDAHFTGSNMQGSFRVNYTLVPQEPGSFQIPARAFSYFNPNDKKYHTVDLRGFTMKVAQGTAVAAVTEQKAIEKGMTDILHIKRTEGTQRLRTSLVFNTAGYWLLYIACAVALAVIIFVYRRNLKLNADVRGRKLARANKQAFKRLKTARAAMQAHDSEQFYKALNSAMWGYISDKLGIPSSQLIRDNISAQLAAKGLPAEGIEDTIEVLDQCEMARFTPQHSDDEMSTILQKAEAAIKAIENAK